MTSTPGAPRAPYSLEAVGFPLPALASLSGRAPLGGAREVAMACLVVARLVAERLDQQSPLTPEQRSGRAKSARQWLGTATMPASIRIALGKLADATAAEDEADLRSALTAVMAVTANHLDTGARLELGRLAQTIAE